MKSMLNLSERFKGVKSYLKRCCMDGIIILSAVEGIDQVLKHNPVLHQSMLNSHYHDCMSVNSYEKVAAPSGRFH